MNRILTATLALLIFGGIGAFAADDHKHDHDQDHGKAIEVGEATLGTTKVTVEMAGDATPGKEVHVELHLAPATPAPKAVRVWVGIENGRGSEKAKAEGDADHPGGYEAHVNVPNPLPAGSKIWISIEPASGDTVKGSLPLPSPKAHAHDHHGHEHKK